MISTKTDSARRTLFSFAGIASIRGLTAISQLIIIAVASQIFEKDAFGRFVICYALARVLQAGCGLGAQSYLLKDIPYRQAHGRPWHSIRSAVFFFVIAPFAICLSTAIFFETLVFLKIPFYPLLKGQGATITIFAFLWTILATLAAYVRTLRSSSEAMLLSELAVPATLLLTMGLGWLAGEISVVWLFLGASLFLFLGELLMLGWHTWKSWLPVGGVNGEPVPFTELRAYWGTVLLSTMTGQLDIILVGTVLSPAAVGIYTIIKRITNVMTLAVSVVVWMYAPQISRASAVQNITTLSHIARRSMQFTLGPAVIILISLLVTLPWWTTYFNISTNETFWLILALMLCGQILSISMGSTMMFATQTGQPLLMVKSLSRAVAIVAPLILIAGSTIGITGVAAAQLVMVVLMKWPVRRYLLKEQGLDVSFTVLFRKPSSTKEVLFKD